MKDVLEIVSDEEMEKVWGNANFGSMSKRDVIRFGLLKNVSGYHQGSTSLHIITELRLVTYANHNITKKGREYLWVAFNEGSNI